MGRNYTSLLSHGVSDVPTQKESVLDVVMQRTRDGQDTHLMTLYYEHPFEPEASIRRALYRLMDEGLVRRVRRGWYAAV